MRRAGSEAGGPSGRGSGGAQGRRGFLARLVLSIGGLIAAAFGAVGAGYIVGSRGRGSRGRWTPVARIAELEPGEPLHVEYLEVVPDAWTTIRRRKSAWLVRRDGGRVTAFDPHCTHLGCPYGWDPADRLFKCPCHGGVFDIDGNVVAGPPPRPLDTLEERIAGGRILVGAVVRSVRGGRG